MELAADFECIGTPVLQTPCYYRHPHDTDSNKLL